jgi:hypothetical protein
MQSKRVTAKMRAIAKILETFFVSIVYSRSKAFTCLEILGTAVNLEIADYVAALLDSELETLWGKAQTQAHLKGAVAKNSFFLGIAKGYCTKIHALKKSHSEEMKHGLMVIEKKLMDAKALVYSRLSSSRSHAGHCRASSALGELMGKQMQIQPALKQKPSESIRLLS